MSTNSSSLSPYYQQLSRTLLAERFRLKRQIQQLTQLSAEQRVSAEQQLQQALGASIEKREARLAAVPKVSYPENLPVSERQADIAQAIIDHQVVIIAGETGSGKTTQIPKICLQLGRGVDGFIGHTQPRRLAARSVASRIAEELGTELGAGVGYKVRFSDQVSELSHIKLLTDGMLLAEIQQDRFLNQYDTIIIDEAHERSLNIDFLLGYFKQLLPKRPELKLIITSATIDPDRFSRHFNNAPIISVSGRTYPVEMRYRPLVDGAGSDKDQIDAIIDAVEELNREAPGDILVFLSGEREIRDTAEALEKCQFRHTEIVPLFARLSAAEQNRVFQSHAGRRIVLATNVAETSLTVPGIRYVIDPGTARISRYSYRTKVQRLPIEAISRASANQRAGRCGRVAPGVCIRLYDEQDYLSRPEFTDPEILRTNLASVILQMLSLGLGDIAAFPFVEPPDSRNVSDGMRLLEELQAIKVQRRGLPTLTGQGRDLAKLPIDPRLARMVYEAKRLGCLKPVMVIVAALSIQDVRERPNDFKQKSDESHARFHDERSDFLAYVNLWEYLQELGKSQTRSAFRKRCQQEFLNYLRVREWQDIYTQIRQTVHELGWRISEEAASFEQIHQALLSGLLSQIGFKDQFDYQGARQSRFHIFPGSGLFKKQPKWVMAAELVETAKLYARGVAKIEPEWLEPLAEHLIKRSYSEPHWEKKQGAVMAFEQQTLYGLITVPKRRVNYSKIDPLLCHQLFLREALVNEQLGSNEGFLAHNRQQIDVVKALEEKSRRRDILVDEETLLQFYASKVPESVTNRAEFLHWWKKTKAKQPTLLNFDIEQLMKHDAKHVTQQQYPDSWQQGNLWLPLEYQFNPSNELDGVSVLVPLALLNQIQAHGFDWHIPAYRHELCVALIKALPKPQRRHFVPAPNFADALMNVLEPLNGALLSQVQKHLLKMTGVRLADEDFDLTTLPNHLCLHFKVMDGDKVLAAGKDLELLKAKLSGRVQETIAQVADKGIEQTGLTDWQFAALPDAFVKKQGQFEIKAFPALVDKGTSVAIELYENQHRAEHDSWLGVRKLILLNIPSPIKYLQEKLPNKAKLGLYFNPFGKINELIDDCIAAAVDAIIKQQPLPRNSEQFTTAKDRVRAEVGDAVVELAKQVEQILTLAHSIKKRMKGKLDLQLVQGFNDIQSQVDNLVFKGFVTQLGAKRLSDVYRYLQAVDKRLDKLPIDPHRDRLQMYELQKVADAYQSLLAKQVKGQPLSEAVAEIRWLQEELRVSLFAQQLGTPMPISSKRILNSIAELQTQN